MRTSQCQVFLPVASSFLQNKFANRPIHVHVRKAGAEAIFDVEDLVELRESQGFNVRDLARAEELAQENRNNIIKAWHEHLG